MQPRMIRGRPITLADVQTVQQLVAEQGTASRWALARALCQRWQWRAANGQWKTRSALAVLTELERCRWIILPSPSPVSVHLKAPRADLGQLSAPGVKPLDGALDEYRPLRWELVSTVAQRRQWRQLLGAYHYLGAAELVGANLKYLVFGRPGELLGALGWQSATQHLGCRDRLIGWNAVQRAGALPHVVNNVRFLVLPWVKVPNLASVILSESLCVLQRDWLAHYGSAVWLVESFVDRQRFSGASYRAANWQVIGWTRGFAKQQGRFIHHGQPKEVYVYVIEPRMRRLVHADPHQPLLTRADLLAQRRSEITNLQPRRTRMKQAKESWQPHLPPEFNLTVEDVACVGQELRAFTQLFGRTFERIEPRELFELYLQGLLSRTQRKNVEAMALALDGPASVRNLQRFVGEYRWDEPWLRQRHWELCAESLSDEQGVWSIDASEFLKKGKASVGVAPQYCGAEGKVANCQSGVFICYSSPQGHALLDSRLYLPQCWFEPAWAERRQQCGIPQEVSFQTKPQLAAALLRPLLDPKLFRGRWLTCDCSFGNNEEFLDELPKQFYYLADIACTRRVWIKKARAHPKLESEGCSVEQLAATKKLLNWQTHKVAEGEKGPIVAAFARVRVYLSDKRTAQSERWLVLRNDADGEIKYALSNAPEDLQMREFVRVSRARWPIERCFQEDKSELGMDHYEHRSWRAWHRHMRLVFLAQLFLLRLRKNKKKNADADAAASAPVNRMVPAGSETGRGVCSGICALSSKAQLPCLQITS
jgi:SRSO17 transposase